MLLLDDLEQRKGEEQRKKAFIEKAAPEFHNAAGTRKGRPCRYTQQYKSKWMRKRGVSSIREPPTLLNPIWIEKRLQKSREMKLETAWGQGLEGFGDLYMKSGIMG